MGGSEEQADRRFWEALLEYENYLVFLIIPLFSAVLLASVDEPLSYWVNLWWMFPVGLAISTVVNMVGISGAALFVPFFILIFPIFAFDLHPEQSVRLGLIIESFGLGSAALAFLRYRLEDKRLGLLSVLSAAPFVVSGALLAFIIPPRLFNYAIAAALIAAVVLLNRSDRAISKRACIDEDVIGAHHKGRSDNVTLVDRDGREYRYCRHGFFKRSVYYGFGGLFHGLAGFGAGEMGVTSMVVTGIPIRVAIGTSHIVVAASSVIASASHLSQSSAHGLGTPWNVLFVVVPAVIIGGQISPLIAVRVRSQALELLVSALLVVLAAALAYLGATAA
ncbi:MAG: TSUP family transporter [Terriglobia bacterium]